MPGDFFEEDFEEYYEDDEFKDDCKDEGKCEEEIDSWDDYCYECGGYGDDYSVDENGELVCNCFTCPFGGQKYLFEHLG